MSEPFQEFRDIMNRTLVDESLSDRECLILLFTLSCDVQEQQSRELIDGLLTVGLRLAKAYGRPDDPTCIVDNMRQTFLVLHQICELRGQP